MSETQNYQVSYIEESGLEPGYLAVSEVSGNGNSLGSRLYNEFEEYLRESQKPLSRYEIAELFINKVDIPISEHEDEMRESLDKEVAREMRKKLNSNPNHPLRQIYEPGRQINGLDIREAKYAPDGIAKDMLVTGDTSIMTQGVNPKGEKYTLLGIFDVSGKASNGADYTAIWLKMHALNIAKNSSYDGASGVADPNYMLSALNDKMCARFNYNNRFSTGLVILIDSKGSVRIAQAGEHPPLLFRCSQKGYEVKEIKNIEHQVVLGVFDYYKYDKGSTIRMHTGDLLVLHNDGILESKLRDTDEELGREKFADLVKNLLVNNFAKTSRLELEQLTTLTTHVDKGVKEFIKNKLEVTDEINIVYVLKLPEAPRPEETPADHNAGHTPSKAVELMPV